LPRPEAGGCLGQPLPPAPRCRSASDLGDFSGALEQYTQVAQQYPDLALAQYARIGRALLLYQQGQVGHWRSPGQLRSTAPPHPHPAAPATQDAAAPGLVAST
jgi:hypothetical protein